MCRVKLACRDGQEVLAERLRYEQAKGRGAPRAGQERIDCGVRTKRGGGLIRSSLGATMAVVGGLHLRSARSDEGPSGRGRAGGGSDAAESLGWAAQWRPRCTVHEVQARAPLWTLSWETVARPGKPRARRGVRDKRRPAPNADGKIEMTVSRALCLAPPHISDVGVAHACRPSRCRPCRAPSPRPLDELLLASGEHEQRTHLFAGIGAKELAGEEGRLAKIRR